MEKDAYNADQKRVKLWGKTIINNNYDDVYPETATFERTATWILKSLFLNIYNTGLSEASLN